MNKNDFKARTYKEFTHLLSNYRQDFIAKGVKLPLNIVTIPSSGLLSYLPAVKNKNGWPWNVQVDPHIYDETINWPKLTIVIPSYNQGEFLEEAIRSVLLQNYVNTELIIIDGGSTDDTMSIIAKYSTWVSYWQSERDKGQGQAINMGFSLANGDYYGWINSDDFYNYKAFYILASEICRTGQEFYYGDAYSVNKDKSEQYYWQAYVVKNIFLRFGGLIASHSAFWKSSIHQPIWEKMNCNVDGELWIRLVKNVSRKHINYPIGSVRLYNDTKSAHIKWKAKWKEDDNNIDKLHGKPPHPRSIKAYFFRFIQHLYKSLLRKAPLSAR